MKLPDLLPAFSIADEQRFFEDMSGWLKLQPVLADIEDPTECLKRLAYEIQYGQRKPIMDRLVQKYNKLKSKEMEHILNEYYYRKSRQA